MARELLPNSTQIPDVILDFWLSELSGAELKVVLYVARRTYGFGKESDNISLTQICSGITRRDGTMLDTGTGLSRSSVARAIKTLEAKQILLRQVNQSQTRNEYEESTYRLNLHWQPNPGSGGGGGQKPVVPESNHPVSKREVRWSQNRPTGSPKRRPGVVPKSNLQETGIQETDQETGAGEQPAQASRRARDAGPPLPPAAASLVEELVSHNLNRCDAIRFALEAPEECCRQIKALEHLPAREDEGAWLARAIPGRFGLPGRLRQKQARQRHAEADRRTKALQRAKLDRQQAFWKPYMQYLRRRRESLQERHSEAYSGFEAQERTEREKYLRFHLNLTLFDSEEAALQRFQAYFADFPSDPVLEFERWDAAHNRDNG